VGELPLYVSASVSRAAMLAGWLRFVGLLAAVLVPVTAGLTYVSLVALRKTRREQAITAELNEAVARRAAAEKGMLESQKLETLAQLTGGVAHDFNNLLAIISSSLHVHRHLHPEHSDERHLQAVSRAVQSGTRLTRQLLSFSRKQALRPELIVLQTWLPGVEGLLRSTLGSRIVMEIAVEPEVCQISVDVAELELALINLALNAKHAMPGGGQLRITARNEGASEDGTKVYIETLEKLGAPVGSSAQFSDEDAAKVMFGSTEGVGVYLNGTDLPDEVYRTSDINELIERLADGLGDAGEMFSYWEGPTETALYYYGASATVMRERMAAVLASHPLAQRCRVVALTPSR